MPTSPDSIALRAWFIEQGLPALGPPRPGRSVPRNAAITIGVLNVLAIVVAPIVRGLVDSESLDGILTTASWLIPGLTILGGAGAGARSSLLRLAIRQARGSSAHFRHVLRRTLPVLMVSGAFLFINAEMWQLASSLLPSTLRAFGYGVLLLLLFIAYTDTAGVAVDVTERFTAAELEELTAGTPVEGRSTAAIAKRAPDPLSPNEHRNVRVLAAVVQLLHVARAAAITGAAYLVLGAGLVGLGVQRAWIGSDPHVLLHISDHVVITTALLKVVAFFTAFTAVSVGVGAAGDESYRKDMVGSTDVGLRQAVAVRHVSRAG